VNVRSLVVFLMAVSASQAAELKQETLAAWDEHVRIADSHMTKRLQPGNSFLWIDENPERNRQVRAGEILISAVGEQNPKKVPSGLVHHWMGAAFIPNATLGDLLETVRDYGRYKDFYKPGVIESTPIRHSENDDEFSMVLANKAVFSKGALDSDYASSYVRVDSKRSYSIAYTTRVQEIKDFGQPRERKLAPNEGSGYIWRLHSITRFEERDNGVYVELEAIALSRDIPATLHWVVDPIVRRVSKSSLFTSLDQTREAVSARSDVARSRGDKPQAAPTGLPFVNGYRMMR